MLENYLILRPLSINNLAHTVQNSYGISLHSKSTVRQQGRMGGLMYKEVVELHLLSCWAVEGWEAKSATDDGG